MAARWNLIDRGGASRGSASLHSSQPSMQVHRDLVPTPVYIQSSMSLIPASQGIGQHRQWGQSVPQQGPSERRGLEPARQTSGAIFDTKYTFNTGYREERGSTAQADTKHPPPANIRRVLGTLSTNTKIESSNRSFVPSTVKPPAQKPATSSRLSIGAVSNGTTDSYESLASLVSVSMPDKGWGRSPSIYGPIQRPASGAELGAAIKSASDEEISSMNDPKGTHENTSSIQSWRDGSVAVLIRGNPGVGLHEAKNRPLTGRSTAFEPIHTRGHLLAPVVQAEPNNLEERPVPQSLQRFRPSNSVLQKMGLIAPRYPQVPQYLSGCSPNYEGDVTAASNHSAEIPDSQNCAVWMLGLPSDVTHTELLGAIRGIGQVYATVINSPVGRHPLCAAKIVFFERYQAEKLMAKILDDRSFQVMGRTIRNIRWNKIKSARYPNPVHSRAIHITGPREFMDFGTFEQFFRSRFTYELEARREIPCMIPGMATHEWRFGSLRCQAAWAVTAIERELGGVVTVAWAVDPCSRF